MKIKINNLSKSFKNLQVLQGISLSVKKGEFVSVIGPSGCGKSTLFNIIAGVEDTTDGEIYIDEKKLSDRKGKTGYMPQNPTLLPWKTVKENVMLGLDVKGVGKKIAEKKAHELLQKFSLNEFANNYPYSLSGGMKQRIALLRTILFHDDFLLLDEPFGALDALTRTSLQIWLLDLWQNIHSSVLFITHDVREAIVMSDRIYVFSKRPGQVIEEVKVTLPRPRKLKNLTSKIAISLEKKLLGLLFYSYEI